MDREPLPPTPTTPLPTASASRAAISPSSLETKPRLAELVVLLAILALTDVAIYRGVGEAYAGWASVFAALPMLLLWGKPVRWPGRGALICGIMLNVLAARVVWCGSLLEKGVGLALVPCLAVALCGQPPYLTDVFAYALLIPYYGVRGLFTYARGTLNFGRRFAPSTAIAVVLPVIIGTAFSLLFVLANPDLVKSVSERLSQFVEHLRTWLFEFSLGECIFLSIVGWIAIALLRGRVGPSDGSRIASETSTTPTELSEIAPRPLYLAWRNSLALVVLIYAVYLVFEFQTLWFRQFPKGFYYSGYAHEGAAWLTIALALATSILSLIFRGRILADSHVTLLKRLAWVWSAENLLLAAAVYHRLLIYVGFNGMTQMRILGFYGVSAVVVGFVLVIVKILQGHNLAWLLQGHLWTLGAAIYLFAITPLDYLAMRYNVSQIVAGNAAPSVQITEHSISTDGLLALFPLLDCSDETIKQGVAALLDGRREDLERQAVGAQHWTAYQISDSLFLHEVRRQPPSAIHFAYNRARANAWMQFKAYAYQWY